MLELNALTKYYPPNQKGAEPLLAVSRLDLTIPQGQFVCVVGPSGCGKTTLLNMIGGFEKPTQGEMLLKGNPVTKPGPDRAVVFQQASLLPWMSVEENVAFGLILRDGRKEYDRDRVREMIDIMGLVGFEKHFPYQLSGGMQQRVAIARALITEPSMLLMDEPFGALDAQTRSDMQEFLLDIWFKLHPTVLFITHDVEESILLSDRVLVMTPRPGKVAADIPIKLPRPRKWDTILSPEFTQHKKEILQILHPAEHRV